MYRPSSHKTHNQILEERPESDGDQRPYLRPVCNTSTLLRRTRICGKLFGDIDDRAARTKSLQLKRPSENKSLQARRRAATAQLSEHFLASRRLLRAKASGRTPIGKRVFGDQPRAGVLLVKSLRVAVSRRYRRAACRGSPPIVASSPGVLADARYGCMPVHSDLSLHAPTGVQSGRHVLPAPHP